MNTRKTPIDPPAPRALADETHAGTLDRAPQARHEGRSAALAEPMPSAVLLVLLTMLVVPGATVADSTKIYRSTAPDGTVQFSDRPAADATLVQPGPLVVVPGTSAVPAEASAAPPLGAPFAVSPDAAPGARIERVEIASPPPDATLLDPPGPLVVEIGTAPGSLSASGLRAEVLLDGEMVAAGHTSSLAVPAPPRGAHELQVRLVAADGTVQVRSERQTLHVRRTLARGMLGIRHPAAVGERTEDER